MCIIAQHAWVILSITPTLTCAMARAFSPGMARIVARYERKFWRMLGTFAFTKVASDAYNATCHMLESFASLAFATNSLIAVVVARLSLVSFTIVLAVQSAANNLPLACTDTARFS